MRERERVRERESEREREREKIERDEPTGEEICREAGRG